MLLYDSLDVHSFDGLTKSPRQWAEGFGANVGMLWLKTRLDEPMVRVISHSEQWRMMRSGGTLHREPDDTLQTMQAVGASPDRIVRAASSSVATSMVHPQIQDIFPRLVLGAQLAIQQ